LNTTPTEPYTLRSWPLHTAQVVNDSSVNACTASKRWPHAVHAY
jgi:hypothetical protein